MANTYFQCSICDCGYYDLSEGCVRSIQGRKVINSTTECIQLTKAKAVAFPRKIEVNAQQQIPGAFGDETKTLAKDFHVLSRTCSSCIEILPEPGCSLRYVGVDNILNVDDSHLTSMTAISDVTKGNVVGCVVAVGKAVAFKVVPKVPKREGKRSSYLCLTAAGGAPFGHRL
ncbi:hypothetical protein GCG54_00015373 [Colletotrichum gloeosporioides]|uniref:Nbr1 FW domain-containing protein n=1 Tax=Colletotrichum gloeosporioides TaxID=474922 RepID=A0A8H4CQA1_COLGL|nr:uncharacterized protein GCG54_00015373 [Colletotrichum gloeosporioides]KAF3807989.1 hypothetical protein GCG54_00015373 [Colletotrichum gloeosporioides]